MRNGSTDTGSGRGFEEGRVIFRGGTCVGWTHVMRSGLMEEAGEEEWEREVGADSEGKLSMTCWNVCRRFKDT